MPRLVVPEKWGRHDVLDNMLIAPCKAPPFKATQVVVAMAEPHDNLDSS